MASTPSGASSRLLTMKFMQRAAAASPSSPGVSQSEDDRPSKRVKTEFGSSPRTPQAQTPLFDQKAAQAALDAEDKKREALIERQAEKLGDAHWRLDPAKLPGSNRRKGVPLNIVQVGFSQIDRSDALATRQPESDGPVLQSYQPNKSKRVNKEDDSSDSDTDYDSDSDSDFDSDLPHSSSEVPNQVEGSITPGRASYGTQKRQELRSRQSAEREKAKKFAKQRRGKDVNLNKLTSISGASSTDFNGKGSNPGRRR